MVGEEQWIYTETRSVEVYIHHHSPPLRGIVVYYFSCGVGGWRYSSSEPMQDWDGLGKRAILYPHPLKKNEVIKK